MFITFEGLDSSGKSTQAKLLAEELKEEGKQVVFLREPGGTGISEKIRSILLDRDHLEMDQLAELFLFSAARTQLVTEVIQPALSAGMIVLCDRFHDSTTAYQGYGRGLDLDAVKRINTVATKGLLPDVTFILDIPTSEIQRRRSRAKLDVDRMESSGLEFYEKVRKGYQAIARGEPKRCVLLDGSKPLQELREEIWSILSTKLSPTRERT